MREKKRKEKKGKIRKYKQDPLVWKKENAKAKLSMKTLFSFWSRRYHFLLFISFPYISFKFFRFLYIFFILSTNEIRFLADTTHCCSFPSKANSFVELVLQERVFQIVWPNIQLHLSEEKDCHSFSSNEWKLLYHRSWPHLFNDPPSSSIYRQLKVSMTRTISQSAAIASWSCGPQYAHPNHCLLEQRSPLLSLLDFPLGRDHSSSYGKRIKKNEKKKNLKDSWRRKKRKEKWMLVTNIRNYS